MVRLGQGEHRPMSRMALCIPVVGLVAVGLACGGASDELLDGPVPTLVAPDEPLLLVSSGEGDGYIDTNGAWVVLPPVSGPQVLVDPQFALVRNGECVVFDRSTGTLTERVVGPATSCRVGEIGTLTVDGATLTLLDVTGRVRNRVELVGDVDLYGAPMAACSGSNACGYLDENLDWVGPGPVWRLAMPFGEGPGVVGMVETATYAFVDAQGQVIGHPAEPPDSMSPFGQERALALVDVERDNSDPSCSYSFVPVLLGVTGEVVAQLPRTYAFAAGVPNRVFSEDYLRIPSDEGDVLVDRSGVIVRAVTQPGWHFSEGLAAVQGPDGWSYVDRLAAAQLIGPYSLGGDFQMGFARVDSDRWLQKNGHIIVAAPLAP